MPCSRMRRSGVAARTSSAAASPMTRLRAAGAPGSARVSSDSAGIEARLQLLVAPLARIPALARGQVGMPALFGEVAFAQHDDAVRIGHRAQPVADDDD